MLSIESLNDVLKHISGQIQFEERGDKIGETGSSCNTYSRFLLSGIIYIGIMLIHNAGDIICL